MFKVMKGLQVLQQCESKKEAISAFATLCLIKEQPTIVVNSHGTSIYSREDYLKENPELNWLFG